MISVGIFYSSILGLNNLQKLNKRVGANLARIVLIALIPINGMIFLNHQVWQDITVLMDASQNRYSDFLEIMKFKNSIPKESVVYTSNAIGPFFADFPRVRTYSQDVDLDYLVIDKKDADYKTLTEPKIVKYREIGFPTVFENDGVVILKRNGL